MPVILAGGIGSRLWPLSRSAFPKQLLKLVSTQHSLLQETILRTQDALEIDSPIVICHYDHRFIVEEQLAAIAIKEPIIILEPIGKNTAPAITIAALFSQMFLKTNPHLLVLPADHLLKDPTHFINLLTHAKTLSNSQHLVTFGVKPTAPETGYGYIETANIGTNNSELKVLSFTEKPDQARAAHYISQNNYFWNSGMFLFKTDVFLNEMEAYAPTIVEVCKKAAKEITKDLGFYCLPKTIFENCPADSLDYALMEKTKKAMLLPLKSHWNDIGSWSSIFAACTKDAAGNVALGDVLTNDVSDSYIRSESRMIAALGITDHIIVETQDAILVAHKDRAQDVKHIVQKLQLQKRTEIHLHRKVYRPWGYYETVDSGENFQVKRIMVKPGARLSLQKHQHRSEHWVVVKGKAEIWRDAEIFYISANESAYIPKGVKHRLTNPTTENLEIIEVQSGEYLGEDDIIRFDDVYNR
jgi:mannose-1-phosphate guanylyltransferase/mannose-6-phosphate isomerase